VNRVFLLGAGFSKAIDDRMPLLGELGERVRADLNSKHIVIGPELDAIEDVEQWLTLLAEPAPWLDLSARSRNTALFADVSTSIRDVIAKVQLEAVKSPKDWLMTLVRHWHDTKATVITFNYDYLVERAYLDVDHADPNRWAPDVCPIPVTPAQLRVAGVGRIKPQTFKLLKLHGSLDWWYSGPYSEQADPIYWMGWTRDPGGDIIPLWSEFGGELLVADKVPMLIPPTATKGPFYRNTLVAAQWRLVAEALNQAEELVMMGYSAPPTDLAVSTLLATQFKGSTIVPLNRTKEILDRAKKLGNRANPPHVDDSFIGTDAIRKWVERNAST
jgi:hypothetical protein